MTKPNRSGPNVRFPPPLIFVGGLAGSALLNRHWPLPLWPGARPATILVLAYILVLLGLVWMGWGALTFYRARTAIIPHRPASHLVTRGPYRFGRNPMYLGMIAVYGGFTLWMNALWGVLLFPVTVALLIHLVIRREEQYLTEAFPAEYEQFRQRVGRWF